MMIPKTTRPADDPRNGPVVLRRDLLANGYTSNSIQRLLSRGDLVRVRPGAYVSPDVWRALDEVGRFGLRGRAVQGQAKTTMALSHLSALAELGAPLWGFDLSDVHVTRTDGLWGRHEAGVHSHVGRICPADLATVNGVLVTNPARAALEACAVGPSEAAFCVLNDLLHRGMVTETDLRSQLVEMESWPGTVAGEVLLRLADARIESVGESRTFWLLYQQHVPKPVLQHEVKDSTGRVVGRLDFAWPELGVWLEFDGREKYEKHRRPGESVADAVVREKNREDLVRRITGWRCVRITWADLRDPARVAAIICLALFPARV
ncbi:type IV toxin-antitoxin system AbiEi family antitoxin domain-containing protein [Nocardioides sp. IC4_145]|uniref:type IV toxin-antitoxin system AbiEi family antitoxin domain-containing protein n=1 Tax=Nocardioides sp. IC4_145 TaxID=2714037 RepID=UPI001A99D341|nr:type IV toxin-antitoxin system AbiEi family antitoxin domain-containing protein [Nocardioides sp. IC4_145]NHC21775.1 type IV toxin-antitoxin system AbiEi family antitoxin domain-containing protein [Nocardioides sp. IC4_145]